MRSCQCAGHGALRCDRRTQACRLEAALSTTIMYLKSRICMAASTQRCQYVGSMNVQRDNLTRVPSVTPLKGRIFHLGALLMPLAECG